MIEPFKTIGEVFGSVLADFREWALDNPLWAAIIIVVAAWYLRDIFGAFAHVINRAADYLLHGAAQSCRSQSTQFTLKADADQLRLEAEGKRSVSSAMVSSALVISVVVVLCTFNYFLLLRPLNDMLGEEYGYVGAIGIIISEFIVGAVVLVCLGRSNFIRILRKDEDRNLVGAGFFFVIFLCLCVVEVLAAFWREVLIQLDMQSNAGDGAAPGGGIDWMPTLMQAILGFAVPWVLMISALSVEAILDVLSLLFRRVGAFVCKFVAILLDWLDWACQIVVFLSILTYSIVIVLPEIVLRTIWYLVEKWAPGFLPLGDTLWEWVRSFQPEISLKPAEA